MTGYAKFVEPDLLRQVLRFEPETGKLFWLPRPASFFASACNPERICNSWNARYAGKEAFTASHNAGYKFGSVFDAVCLAHRIAWAVYYGEWPDSIDHINGNRSDNRISNMRSVVAQDNSKNAAIRSDNTSGHIGVHWHTLAGKWAASIKGGGKMRHLGLFDDMAFAIAARKRAETKYGFHPNHGRASL